MAMAQGLVVLSTREECLGICVDGTAKSVMVVVVRWLHNRNEADVMVVWKLVQPSPSRLTLIRYGLARLSLETTLS